MKLKKGTSVLEVETSRSFYLFLNGKWIMASDHLKDIDIARIHVLSTLIICGVQYSKSPSLYEDEDGYMHEVHEITAEGLKEDSILFHK